MRTKTNLTAALMLAACIARANAVEAPHWAFQPVSRPEAPRADGVARTAIDAFVLEKLGEMNLAISPEADRRTLARRLYFDLTGLPPTPGELKEFEEGKISYDGLVERLLASPRHGERWARHWLDVVRFAETHGFEMNQPRPNAWPYRDYVIRSFNQDKPYNRFVIEQIAGDVFGADEATGFLVAGPWDQVKSPDPVLTANQRADELHDMVSTTASAFLGLTVGCARCHDHKFDPVPQTDYYAMQAVFAGVQHGERTWRDRQAQAREEALARAQTALKNVEEELDALEPAASIAFTNAIRRAPVNARRNIEKFQPVTATQLRFAIAKTTDLEPCLDELEVYSIDRRNVALASFGTKALASSVYPNSEIHRLEHVNDGRHGNGRSWISSESGKGWVLLEFPRPVVIDKIVWGRDREERFADRLALEYRIEVIGENGVRQLVSSSEDRTKYDAKRKEAASFAAMDAESADRARKLLERQSALRSEITRLSRAAAVYAGVFTETPGPTPRLHRGDPMQPREEVQPGAVRAIPVRFEETQAGDRSLTEDQKRRLALARWIASESNPLAARVMVNRIWQHHFGQGLVATPSDFGAHGTPPTHPRLLDWLAAEFMAKGWSVKHIHKLIVMSAAYRQSSAARTDGLQRDADSRFLWRFPPRRLEAEAIRDSILAVSGKLNERMGGAGFSFFEPNDNYVRVYTPRSDWTDDSFRRMIYGTVVRQRPDGVFGVFDCPDAGQIAPKRASSTTPLQALNLLNSTFIARQSAFFAERLEREAGPDVSGQIERAFALAFQRQPTPDELEAARRLAGEQGLAVFCRALFNANEFVYVF